MIKYTFEEIKELASEIALYHNDKDIKFWYDIVYKIRERIKDNKEIILELICDSVFALTREFSKKTGLTGLIFDTPVEKMPLYIESKEPWEIVVARWRIAIQK